MTQYIIRSQSIRVLNLLRSWKYTTFLIAYTYNRVNFIILVINIVFFYSWNVGLYGSKPFHNHITTWANVTPLKLCIHLPSGVVGPLSLYQTQRYNCLSNLFMALFVFINFCTTLIIFPHVFQLYFIIIGHKHDIIYAYMYHIHPLGEVL